MSLKELLIFWACSIGTERLTCWTRSVGVSYGSAASSSVLLSISPYAVEGMTPEGSVGGRPGPEAKSHFVPIINAITSLSNLIGRPGRIYDRWNISQFPSETRTSRSLFASGWRNGSCVTWTASHKALTAEYWSLLRVIFTFSDIFLWISVIH